MRAPTRRTRAATPRRCASTGLTQAHGGPTDFAYADEIAWGTDGDFMRAVRLLKEHAHMTDEQAKGYANLMHHRALGYWPAQHARMEGKGE